MSISQPSAHCQDIDNQGRLDRDLTTQIAFPKEIQFLEAADMLLEQYGSRAIHGIQPLSGNRMQVTFNGPAFVNSAVNNGLKYKEKILDFQAIGRPSVWITIKNCPLEMSGEAVARLISQYGTIEQNYKERDEKRGWFNGTRKIKMKMAKPIPNILQIGIYPIYIMYEGVEQLCRRCRMPNHQAYQCTVAYCHRCRILGHSLEDCPKKRRIQVQEDQTLAESNELPLVESSVKNPDQNDSGGELIEDCSSKETPSLEDIALPTSPSSLPRLSPIDSPERYFADVTKQTMIASKSSVSGTISPTSSPNCLIEEDIVLTSCEADTRIKKNIVLNCSETPTKEQEQDARSLPRLSQIVSPEHSFAAVTKLTKNASKSSVARPVSPSSSHQDCLIAETEVRKQMVSQKKKRQSARKTLNYN